MTVYETAFIGNMEVFHDKWKDNLLEISTNHVFLDILRKTKAYIENNVQLN